MVREEASVYEAYLPSIAPINTAGREVNELMVVIIMIYWAS